MTNSSANVRSADSGSMKSDHLFPWKWNLSDLEKVEKNGKNVFSCFSCGGGSSMGYKLAGFTVVGCCEIDPRMLEIYKANLHPLHPYCMDVRDFLKVDDLPEELYHLDILDGSPPCSVFSMAGDREDGWNKEKVFREGQAKQKLDDLFFHFIAIAKRLQPKVVIAENVSGLIKGNAKGYVNEIFKAFQEAGYVPQLFLLNSAFMGVPQRRERTVFVARRKDLILPKLALKFNEAPIYFGEVRSEKGRPVDPQTQAYKLLQLRRPGDKCMGDINMRWKGKNTGFTVNIVADTDVSCTLTSGGGMYRDYDAMAFGDMDFVNIQTFPQDYDFGQESPQYVCGMSVPPVMMANIATEVYQQWLKD